MKKIVYFILFIIVYIFSNNLFALEIQYNTESNVKKAILVEDYIIRHKEKINSFIEKYDINNNIDLNNDISALNESIDAIRKIQTTNIEKQKAEDIMKAVLVRIKKVNDSLEKKLRIEKEKYEIKIEHKKEAYSKLGKKLSDKIYSINLKIARNVLKNNGILSLKESRIKQSLINLNKESQKLRNIGSLEFKSEKEIKDYFIIILTNIKKEISIMKELLK